MKEVRPSRGIRSFLLLLVLLESFPQDTSAVQRCIVYKQSWFSRDHGDHQHSRTTLVHIKQEGAMRPLSVFSAKVRTFLAYLTLLDLWCNSNEWDSSVFLLECFSSCVFSCVFPSCLASLTLTQQRAIFYFRLQHWTPNNKAVKTMSTEPRH